MSDIEQALERLEGRPIPVGPGISESFQQSVRDAKALAAAYHDLEEENVALGQTVRQHAATLERLYESRDEWKGRYAEALEVLERIARQKPMFGGACCLARETTRFCVEAARAFLASRGGETP